MSLQTGQPLARIGRPIVNPHDLHVVAFYVEGPRLDFQPAVLFSDDIREFGPMGVIVDGSDNIMNPDGLVRLAKILGYGFELDGIKVIDDHKHKLGTVENYVIDSSDFEIQQLFVRPTFGKRFSITHLAVHRKQIIEIDNEKIVVSAPTNEAPVADTPRVPSPNEIPFENPFRGQPVPAPNNKTS
jgi:sporulation protein YlmC with PRC-barrel domain